MSIDLRLKSIEEIEKLRGSKVITYFLGTKPNLPTQMGTDAIRYIYEHLKEIGKCDKIDLFIYTTGGDILAPHRLTRLIRGFCGNFSVLVPFRAHSAATLLCLGADEIVMGKMGELSPIDPTTANPFNPTNPHDKTKVIPISVEDVTSFLALAEEKALLRGEDKTLEVFKDLTGPRELSLHPLALGNVYRVLRLIRDIAKKQLMLHLDEKETAKIQRIAQKLTELLYSHQYLIDREEAKEMELNVVDTETVPKLDETMWELYKLYEDEIKMQEPFDPSFLVEQQLAQSLNASLPENLNLQLPPGITAQTVQPILAQIQNRLTPPPVQISFTNYIAFIESKSVTHTCKAEGKIIGHRKPSGEKEINVEFRAKWERIR
jgi:hypothetical protein